MHGVIAAGSDVTADAGAEILRIGGNAVDAVVGACLATAAGEPTLTSLAGGGILLHRDAKSGEVTTCDFFSNAPGLGASAKNREFYPVEIDFGPTRQRFYIGAGSAAVPGALPGLFSAWERWGSLPLKEVIAPACRVLREGVVLGVWQERAAALLKDILLRTEEGRAQFAFDGHLMRVGDRFVCPNLADTLEGMAEDGWRKIYDGPVREKILACSGPEAGGMLSAEDLDAYEVIFREPLSFEYRGRRVHTNPPPGAGGEMVAMMVKLLEASDLGAAGFGSVGHVRAICHAQRVADEARLTNGGPCYQGDRLAHWQQSYATHLDAPLSSAPNQPGGPGSTTHVSVVDAAGNAATVTFSYGEGNGHIVPGTGIMMNNLMGEEDLFPQGLHSWPAGARLSTMMCPTIVECPTRGLIVLGTGGANRIRSALAQAIVNLVDFGMDVEAATHAPRLHYESGVLNAEVFAHGISHERVESLRAPELVTFPEPNLFFGGVHLVRLAPDGGLSGAGDPRRGGAHRLA